MQQHVCNVVTQGHSPDLKIIIICLFIFKSPVSQVHTRLSPVPALESRWRLPLHPLYSFVAW
jgi:hypothetical protein